MNDKQSSLGGASPSFTLKKKSSISKFLNFHPFGHTTSTLGISSVASSKENSTTISSSASHTREKGSLVSSQGSTISIFQPTSKKSRTSSLFSALGKRFHSQGQPWTETSELDTNAAQKLRQFYIRNNEACNRDAQELNRRATLSKIVQQTLKDPEVIVEIGKEKWISESEKEEDVSCIHIFSPCTHENDVPYKNDFSPCHQKLASRKSSVIKPVEDLVEAVTVLQGFARSTGSRRSSAEELIQPYDVFSPDMRSTRWDEFCQVLQHDRADFDQYLKTVRAVRGSNRAATLGGTRGSGIPSLY